MPQVQVVFLKSNDPQWPELAVRFRVGEVTGGLVAKPSAVQFGRVVEGQAKSASLEIWDTFQSPRKVTKVVPSHPEFFSAELLGPAGMEAPPSKESMPRALGRIEVKLNARSAQPVDGFVCVYVDDLLREPEKIPVQGEIQSRYTLSPPRAFLAAERPELEVSCHDLLGGAFRVEVESTPAEVEASVVADHSKPQALLRLRLVRIPDQNRAMEVKLRVVSGEAARQLLFPVFHRATRNP